MNDLSEREILSHLEDLRKAAPPRERSASAVERAISGLHSPAVAPRSRKLVRRLVISGSIAAGLALAAGLIWVAGTSHEVTAAELLQQVLQTASAYRGWVHYVYPANDGKLPEAVNGVYPGWHMNRADGTSVQIGRNQDAINIDIQNPARGETASYDSKTNEIRLGDIHPYNTRAVTRLVSRMPIDFESQLAFFREATGREPLQVTRDQNATGLHIHIRYFKDEAEAAEVLKPIADYGSIPVETMLTIDPQTRLIQTKRTTYVTRYQDGIRSGGTDTTRVFYGEPTIRDIYDAGAPRNAVVKDLRITGEAKLLWQRLEQRRERGYGDGIALLSVSHIGSDGDVTQFSVRLYMQKAAVRYHGEYYVNSKPGRDGQPRIAPFDDWPTPDLQEVLKRARRAQPWLVFVTDGKRAWGGAVDSHLARWLTEQDLSWWDDSRPHRISGEVWPSRDKMSLYGSAAEFSMSRDAEHPDRLLLHSRSLSKEQRHWLDSSRDDMPLRTLRREFAGDGKTVEGEFETEFLEWAQMADGRWFPTHWRERCQFIKHGHEQAWEYRLRIYPDAPIDPVWLQLPPTTTSPSPSE